MSSNAYGTLGNEMRAMKDGRKGLMAGVRRNRRRIRTETGQLLAKANGFVCEIGKANDRLASQTRQTLAKADKDLRAQARQTMADTKDLLAAIRKDVAALKADAGRITTEAQEFLGQTGSENAKLRAETHKMLANARAGSKAQARQALTEAKATVVGLKVQTDRILAEAADVMLRLCEASRQRAAAWRDIIRSMQDGPSQASAGAAPRAAAPAGSRPKPAAKVTARKPRRSPAKKSRKRKVS